MSKPRIISIGGNSPVGFDTLTDWQCACGAEHHGVTHDNVVSDEPIDLTCSKCGSTFVVSLEIEVNVIVERVRTKESADA